MKHRDRLITGAEMSAVDSRCQSLFGIPGPTLMENAGQKAWRELATLICGHSTERPTVVFVAGGGNNGGDALVMARHAVVNDAVHAEILTIRDRLTGAVGEQWHMLERMGLHRTVWSPERDAAELLHRADWIVDGITGTGLSSPLRDDVVPLVRAINAAAAAVVAVDVPSGFRDGGHPRELRVRADYTIVTGYRKTFLYDPILRNAVGTILQVDPGFPPVLIEDASLVKSRVRLRVAGPPDRTDTQIRPAHPLPWSPDEHKGTRGKVAVVGGSSGAAGAPVLSALAALNAGAGMTRIVGSAESASAALAREPGIMAEVEDGSSAQAARVASWADCLVLGPGWIDGDGAALGRWVSAADEAGAAVVVDASALAHLEDRSGAPWSDLWGASTPVVLTPHLGEFARLTGRPLEELGGQVFAELLRFPARKSLAVLVKSSVSLLRQETGEVEVFDGRCPQLAVAGSGDVLAGVLGASLARTMAHHGSGDTVVAKALTWAVQIHLVAGRETARGGRIFTAGELASALRYWGGS